MKNEGQSLSQADSMYELVDVVTETGEIVRQATREEVTREGLLHPAVHIAVIANRENPRRQPGDESILAHTKPNPPHRRGRFGMKLEDTTGVSPWSFINSRGEIYLQQRSATKRAFPLYWDISASEHVRSGEPYEAAAIRGLHEELGITASVTLVRDNHIQRSEYKQGELLIKEYELTRLYATVYDGTITIDPQEVVAGKFVTFDELRILLVAPTEHFAPWGSHELLYLVHHYSLVTDLLRGRSHG